MREVDVVEEVEVVSLRFDDEDGVPRVWVVVVMVLVVVWV